MEDRNHYVHRHLESEGVHVSRLKRVRYGNIFIPSHVRVGQWLELNDKEIRDLCLTAGLEDVPKIKAPTPAEKLKRERHEKRLRASAARPTRKPPRPDRKST